MNDLDREIRRLQQRSRELEQAFDANFDHLQANYRLMALRSFLGSRWLGGGVGLAGLLLRLMESEPLQDGLMALFDKLGLRLGRLFRRSGDKTTRAPEEDPASAT